MKKLLLFIVLFLLSFKCFSQDSAIESKIMGIMNESGWTHSTTQYADISQGNTAYFWKTFSAGLNYAIVAFPEEAGVNDLDIFLYDDDLSLLTQGNSNNNLEILTYLPYTTRNMKVVIKNYSSYSSEYKYRVKFIIFYK